jgi:hypothetical protein
MVSGRPAKIFAIEPGLTSMATGVLLMFSRCLGQAGAP